MGLDARVPENSRRFSEVDLGGRIDEYDGAAVESELHHRRPGHVSDARLYSWSRATSLDIAKSGRRQCPTMDTRCQRARYLASAIDRAPSRSLRASAETHSGRVPPPDDHLPIMPERRQQKVPGRFGDEERHDAGGIPEPHRPSRRSSSRAWTTLAPGWGAGLRSASRGSGLRARRRSPARSRRASRSSACGAASTRSRRATG
jgi:hypothetical protein